MSPARAALLFALLLVATPARGQVSEERVRAAIEDATRGLGQAIAGGSALLGPSAMTGGPGHFALGAGGALTMAEVEDPTRSSGTVQLPVPVGTVHAAVGLRGGSDAGPAGFGALDLVGRFGTVVAREDLAESAAVWSVGARVGLLPGVSVTAYQTWADELAWRAGEDEPSFNAEVRALSLRADLSLDLLVVRPYAGAGVDRTSIDAAYRIPAGASTGEEEIEGTIETSSTHVKAYGGVAVRLLPLVDTTLELGGYEGGLFGAVGVRIAH